MKSDVLYEGSLPGGGSWSRVIQKGSALEIADPEGGACAAFLAYNAFCPTERYDMYDTLRLQFVSRLGKGHALYSDEGRALLDIEDDSFGGHDAFGATIDQRSLETRFGLEPKGGGLGLSHRSSRTALLDELCLRGMDEGDLVPHVNWFARTAVTERGKLTFIPESKPGSLVRLRARMDVLVVMAATQHRLDPRPEWRPRPLGLRVLAADTLLDGIPGQGLRAASPIWAAGAATP